MDLRALPRDVPPSTSTSETGPRCTADDRVRPSRVARSVCRPGRTETETVRGSVQFGGSEEAEGALPEKDGRLIDALT